MRENGLLKVLTKNGQLQASLVGGHTGMVQLPLSVVRQGLCVAEVVTEGGVHGSLVGKSIGVDSPVVLVVMGEQLVVVDVDEARDSVSEDTHKSIAPRALDHLEGEIWRSRQDLLPADLANELVRQLAGTLLKETVASDLRTRASEMRG
jgi:hypothetical protein